MANFGITNFSVKRDENFDTLQTDNVNRLPRIFITQQSATTVGSAKIAYNLADDKLYYSDGLQWLPVGGGAQGSQGVQGPQGAQGAQGSSIQGPQGSQGTTGIQGPQGPAGGPQGPQGSQGVQGPQGPQGFQGPQGAQGSSIQGPQGSQGAQGPGGGAQGAQGPQGPQGTAGTSVQGPQGPQGAQGTAGASVQGPQGPQGTAGASVQGPQGAQGSQGPAGSGLPSMTTFSVTTGTGTVSGYIVASAAGVTVTGNPNPQGNLAIAIPSGVFLYEISFRSITPAANTLSGGNLITTFTHGSALPNSLNTTMALGIHPVITGYSANSALGAFPDTYNNINVGGTAFELTSVAGGTTGVYTTTLGGLAAQWQLTMVYNAGS